MVVVGCGQSGCYDLLQRRGSRRRLYGERWKGMGEIQGYVVAGHTQRG